MSKRVLILGGGTAGTLLANRLRRDLPPDDLITVVDRDAGHLYQPGLLFVPFGTVRPERLTRARERQLHRDIAYRQCAVDHADLEARRAYLDDGSVLDYDVLVVATGAELLPGETPGLSDATARGKAFTFYDLPGATGLRDALQRFTSGRLAVNVIDLPIKCPVAPIEFCFLADAYFRKRGIRDQIELTLVTPLDGAFTKPVCNRELSGMLRDKRIQVVTEFNTGEIDADSSRSSPSTAAR